MLKKGLLTKSGLYLVTDTYATGNKDILHIISRSLVAGVDMVQYRDKRSSDKEFIEAGFKIKKVTAGKNALFIVNDRIDAALALDADGIHLGQGDFPVTYARKILGKQKIIGISAHSIKEAKDAEKGGADYVAIGAIFPTPVKQNYKVVGLGVLKKVLKTIDIPVVAIGGINESNIKVVAETGVKRIAVVRAILHAPDPFLATKRLLSYIK